MVRLSSRAPSRSSSAWTWLLTIVVDMLSRRPAAENPPLSTTRTKAVRLVNRSIGNASDYPPSLDNASSFPGIITSRTTLHLAGVPGAPLGGRPSDREDAMSTVSYVSDTKTKISLRLSRQAVKRAALALALALGVAAAADFGYGYLTTGRYLESTDDAYVKADFDDHLAKSLRLHRAGAGRRQSTRQGRRLAGPDRRPRFQGRARPGPRGCRGVRGRGAQPRCADRLAAANHRAGHGRRRRHRSQSEIRPGRAGPLRRPDEDRLRHGAAGAADRRRAARQQRAIAALQSPACLRPSARSTFSPPNAPRRSHNSTAPARSKRRPH